MANRKIKKPGAMRGGLWRPVFKDSAGTVQEQPEFWCKYYDSQGKVVRKSTGETDRKLAEQHLRDCKTAVLKAREIPTSPDTLRSLLQLVISNYSTTGKRSLKLTNGRIHNHILKWDLFATCKASEVTTAKCAEYVKWRQSQPGKHSNGTINRELSLIKYAFSLGQRENPPRVAFKPYIAMLPESKPRQGFFEDWDFDKVVGHLPEQYRNLIRFLKITSWRIDEARLLTWDRVDLYHQEIRLDDSKSGDGRWFPLNIDVLENLIIEQRIAADTLEDKTRVKVRYVFFKPDGSRIGDIRKAWTTACQKAGLPMTERPQRTKSGEVILYKRGTKAGQPKMLKTAVAIPHDLRRTGVRNFKRRGLSDDVAMKLSGHKTTSMLRRYNIVDKRDLILAGEMLNNNSHGQSKRSK